jgi:hypothetical protein
LVEHAVVARRLVRRFGGQFGMGEVPQRTKPVVDRDQYYALPGERNTITRIANARSLRQCTAMNPHEDGTFVSRGGRGPYVQE